MDTIEGRNDRNLAESTLSDLMELFCNLMEIGPDTNFKRACLDRLDIFKQLM